MRNHYIIDLGLGILVLILIAIVWELGILCALFFLITGIIDDYKRERVSMRVASRFKSLDPILNDMLARRIEEQERENNN